VVNPQRLPVNNAKEMVALLKAKPDQYNFGSSGNGTILHLAAEMFVDGAGVKARHIPYKGAGQMITDLIGGQVDFGVPFFACIPLLIESFEPAQCPLCAQGVELKIT